MPKRVFIIHGWGGNSKEYWFVWLKKELEKRGFKVRIPTMPNSNSPKISSWVKKIKKEVGEPNEETYFVGHSIGCQAIIRYFESLKESINIGGAIFVAGWFHLKPAATQEEGTSEIAEPWLKTPVNFNLVREHTKNFIAIVSDNDPYVPLEDKEIFKNQLKCKVIIKQNKGHLSGGEDNIKEIPSVLKEMLRISKEK